MFLSWTNKLLRDDTEFPIQYHKILSMLIIRVLQDVASAGVGGNNILARTQDDQRRSDHGGLIRVFSIHSAIHITIR